MYRVSQQSNRLKTFVYISTYSRPPQMKINPVVCHLYPHLCTNFGPLISMFVRAATIFVTLTSEFYQFIIAFCSIHKLHLKQAHYINEIIR